MASELDVTREAARLGDMAKLLLAWYDENARDLPWRRNADPYWIWLSEIMLQQTRMEAAVPYFERFVAALPTVEALAAASEEAVLKLWEGLGYYSRARNLHKAAKIVAHELGGAFPQTAKELAKLPGIGPYTAGAIASTAFGERVAAVDGNVLRVLLRLCACELDASLPATKKAVGELVLALQSPDRPGDYNQSVMELGALVCLPNGAPRCGECPLNGICAGYAQGVAAELPVVAAKKQRRIERRTVVLAVCDGKLLLHRRAQGLLRGLYEPINLEGWLGEDEVRAALAGRGLRVTSLTQLNDAKHVFTHVEWHMRGWRAEVAAIENGEALQGVHDPRVGDPRVGDPWATKQELRESYALPSAFKAYTQAFLEGED